MTFALIQNGIIVNLVIASNEDVQDPAYTWVDITSYTPAPSIGWITSDNINFLPPSGLPLDAYGNLVTFSTDGTNDYYVVAGITYTFPTGTAQAVVYLSIAIKENLQMFMLDLQGYIQSIFSTQVQLQFVCMYLAAQAGGLTNRAAYIGQILTWLNSVEAYAASYVSTVQGLKSVSTVASTTINTGSIATPPSVTLMGAISISS